MSERSGGFSISRSVLLIDADPQDSLTISLGNPQPDKLPLPLSEAMGRILMGEPLRPGDGIPLTITDSRTNFAREIAALLRETYGSKIKVFGTEIPHSVRAKEISAEGKSIFAHDLGGKVAEGYKNLTQAAKLEKIRNF